MNFPHLPEGDGTCAIAFDSSPELSTATIVWRTAIHRARYIEALSLANLINSSHPWPIAMIVPAKDLDAPGINPEDYVAVARLVHPGTLNDAQLRGFAAAAIEAADILVRTMTEGLNLPIRDAGFPSLDSPSGLGFTRDRVEKVFRARGLAEVPADDATQMLNLSFSGTPVDIPYGDPSTAHVRVIARVPMEPDAARLVDLCNRVNLNELSEPTGAAVCVIFRDDQWWAAAEFAAPCRAGLSDEQVDQAVRLGVVGAATQLRSVLHRI